jgi:hypothetical protein
MRLHKNLQINMSASASLSGGPAKEAEKRKKAESYPFSPSLLHASFLKTGHRLFLFAGLFISFRE